MASMAYSLVADRGNTLKNISKTHRIKIKHSFPKMKALNNTVLVLKGYLSLNHVLTLEDIHIETIT
jgi:hypothetical protein